MEDTQDNVVTVRSEKDPSILYDVNITTGECSCPHFQLRLKPQIEADGIVRNCKHLDMVRRLQSE